MTKILITGGSGLVGKALTQKLLEKGYSVNWLSHSGKKIPNVQSFKWNFKEEFIEEKAFEGVSYIIHLAGAGIAEKPWSKAYKNLIADSRIKTSQLLFDCVKRLQVPLKAFISASAIGYYGTFTSEEILTEDSPSGNDFLAKVCIEWENKAEQFQQINIRNVCVRTGVVLSEKGGALPQIKRPISLGLGAALGSGKQYMPWIHINDLVAIYLEAIENNKWQGSYNATSPGHITNQQVTKQIAQSLKKPLWLPNIPSFVLRIVLRKRAELLLKGSRILPKRSQEENFVFNFLNFRTAIATILHK